MGASSFDTYHVIYSIIKIEIAPDRALVTSNNTFSIIIGKVSVVYESVRFGTTEIFGVIQLIEVFNPLFLRSYHFIMLALTLLFVAPLVSAKNYVSGTGRLNSGSEQEVQFSWSVYASSIQSISSSVNNGPNRTVSSSLPVKKLYGVNVCFSL